MKHLFIGKIKNICNLINNYLIYVQFQKNINYNYKENDMNKNTMIAIAITASFISGGVAINKFSANDSNIIHKTRSGSFIIQKNIKGEEQIYQVLELPSNVTSFVTPN